MGKGHLCPNVAKSANCGGAHGARAHACCQERGPLVRQGMEVTTPSTPGERGRAPRGARTRGHRGRKRWARWGPRRGSSPAQRVWRSRRPGGKISRCFVFSFSCFFFSFAWRIWGEGDKGALLGSSVFGLGQDLVKGGKMVTAAMALRAACSGIGKYKITHTRQLGGNLNRERRQVLRKVSNFIGKLAVEQALEKAQLQAQCVCSQLFLSRYM